MLVIKLGTDTFPRRCCEWHKRLIYFHYTRTCMMHTLSKSKYSDFRISAKYPFIRGFGQCWFSLVNIIHCRMTGKSISKMALLKAQDHSLEGIT